MPHSASRIGHTLFLLVALALIQIPAVIASPATDLPVEAFSPAPLFGADVRSLIRVPGKPDVVLAGTSAGHVYRSANEGRTWKPMMMASDADASNTSDSEI